MAEFAEAFTSALAASSRPSSSSRKARIGWLNSRKQWTAPPATALGAPYSVNCVPFVLPGATIHDLSVDERPNWTQLYLPLAYAGCCFPKPRHRAIGHRLVLSIAPKDKQEARTSGIDRSSSRQMTASNVSYALTVCVRRSAG